jgi:ubiquinone/menaquinone biosynthesis C-methylase UbiE
MIETITDHAAAAYAPIADEYYDAIRHPTCADFRWASDRLLDRVLPAPPGRSLCDVGAGDSALAGWLARNGLPISGLLLFDASHEMLVQSQRWVGAGAIAEVADARALPVADRSLELVVASLADPFDDFSWWKEVRRVLAGNGRVVVTTPAVGWATKFRKSANEPSDYARFVKRNGSFVDVPSYVRAPADERELISSAGLRVLAQEGITRGDFPHPVSAKLEVLLPDDPVVVAYVAGH